MIQKLFQRIRLAVTLGADISSALHLLLVGVFLPVIRKIIPLSSGPKVVRITAFGNTATMTVADGSDIAVLCEIFLDREYDLSLPDAPEVILDLGSNVGVSVLYFKLKYPHAKVFAFEPNPSAFARLKENIAQFPDVKAFPVATGGKDGEVHFFVHPESSMSSSLSDRVGQGMKEITVPSVSLSSALQMAGVDAVDLLKFDIEGAEFALFEHADLSSISALVGEVHLDLANVTGEEMLACFSEYQTETSVVNSRRFLIRAFRR